MFVVYIVFEMLYCIHALKCHLYLCLFLGFFVLFFVLFLKLYEKLMIYPASAEL